MSFENINQAIRAIGLETTNKELRESCEHISATLDKSLDLQKAVTILSEHIIHFEDAKLFSKYLSNILLALVSTRIPLKPVFSSEDYNTCNDAEKTNHLEYSIVLSLLSDHPDILQYALKYFDVNKVPPFEVFIHHEDAYNVAPKKRRLQSFRQKISDYHIVLSCFNLLRKLPNEFSTKWDWSKFIANFSYHENIEIRWMLKETMVILTNMTEAQSKLLAKNINLSEEDCLNCLSTLNKSEEKTTQTLIKNVDLDNVVNIDGILLPIYDPANVLKGNLVPVKSTTSNLRSLALAVASGQALSLLGPVGSGKTSLVEYLAAITGRKGVAFKKVQLGDQTDSRMLLGSHQCKDIPGEFVWRPGVLTEAVQNGHWLLLEDIDCAALDVASTLSSLLERNTLCVPGYRDFLPVAPGFQLFVTQRTLTTNYGFQKKMSNSSTLLQKHLTQINVEPLSRSELSEIIQTLFPSLATISPRMIEVFMMFSVGSHDTSLQTTETIDNTANSINIIRGSRLISTRDLMKWCARSVVGFQVSSPDSALKVLQDALDIFTCSVALPENRVELAKRVGTCLGIVETKSEFYCKHYKPNVSLKATSLEVGRARVPRVEKTLESINLDSKQVVFSFTRQSACLLERIACCVMSNEPVLLVGETGTGKTSSVQYLARQTGHKLVVINMNQQSDSADLLGGYKPVDLKYVVKPIKNEFEVLFRSFYNVDKNIKFLNHIETCFNTENWQALLVLMKQSYKAAIKRLVSEKEKSGNILKKWMPFGHKLSKLEQQIKAASRLTFAFIEGSLVKAMQEGYWVLLDEINLASAEILECLAGLLEDKDETVDLLEKGDKVPIKRHPDFTLFACMNPATDVGKKDLPVGLRNRFTEFFIDELTEKNDIILLVGDYLAHMNLPGAVLEAIYVFYASIRKEAKLNLVDGSGNAPHYSLRTLCRALTAAAKAKCGTVTRSLYEAFCLSFLTQLDRSSHPIVEAMIAKAVIGKKNIKSVLNTVIPEPQIQGQNYLLFENHWIPQGKLEPVIPDGYILTPTVRKNLRDIARVISLGRLPVLLQGDTSVGKTSLITYIAKASGNYCVRINNHEHTDLQEYIGSYATNADGKLVFKEGVLVEAMRKGYWIILDELNLAPSDVLEALNRVLDDNRELYIPETQQVVKADPNFMLFATQNPPGLYGGRKMLSRAFRNRFVELHFDEIPKPELETILHKRCHVPLAYSKKMIAVMAELQIRRRGSAAVQGKDGFITLRDLFRWGQRYKLASKEMLTDEKFYDWNQHIADEGYLVLAGKVRQRNERIVIEEVINKHIKRTVNPDNLFCISQNTSTVSKHILELILNNQIEEFSHVVWTYNMRRLAVLIAKAFTFQEPVLLVGETGCGKTTICQVLAALRNLKLLSVNCHMHTESSDFLGGLRPVRQYNNDGRLFEWVDGPLIKAMETGNMFLADEISLADDSVLERLNSLLEPERQLVLSERGMEDNSDIVVITAQDSFHFIGTMNPGGDFGKKELSPALRNRFTEIWCDSVTSRDDMLKVLEKSVGKGMSLGNQEDGSSGIGNSILDFTVWLKNSEVTSKFPFSIRDLLSWVQFINTTVTKGLLDTPEAYVHGACMTFLDCFGTALTGHVSPETLLSLRETAINFLLNQIKTVGNEYTDNLSKMLCNKLTGFEAEMDSTKFGINPFYIEKGPYGKISDDSDKFTFNAPTTGSNTLRLLRGLQLNKAILLEGNPGVGKTSLVTALAKSSGHKVVRINLSDQTDITDLFGTDLPTEDGSFRFKEGAFLNALQNGDWILLDELNLAPQPVLEGLNACLDHRGEVFIPELGKVFKVQKETRLFACQNPLKQGGARRGLPVSFLNRFTQVYIDTLNKGDLIYIVEAQYPSIPKDILHKMVAFNCQIAHEVTEVQSWGHRGGPWEMNLRDIQRWCQALIGDQTEGNKLSPGKFVDMLYINRMRTSEDKDRMTSVYDKIFCPEYPRSNSNPQFMIDDQQIVIGDVSLPRNSSKSYKNRRSIDTNSLILRSQMSTLKALAENVKMNWLTILVGPTATGKSSIIQVLADLTSNDLQIVPVTSAMDVSDLLGGFEQVDYNRNLENMYDNLETITLETVRNIWLADTKHLGKSKNLLNQLHEYKSLQADNTVDNNATDSVQKFNNKVEYLTSYCENLFQYNKDYPSTSSKVQEVARDLKTIKGKVANITSVSAGGKFEWVDSLLVKTLTEGSWLLLDNVNLTSSAVLDRLNGLLEHNGVLSIPERGDFCDIKPHPNFRVFFTMDPKYGEISRAMRNRGVEIFLLKQEDWNVTLTDTLPYLDLVALLSSCGLPDEYHDICLNCHDLMTSFVQGFERPTISHLLQAAHLSWQQIVRGIPYKTAIVNSFSDVYIKPRSGADFSASVNTSLAEMKNTMLKDLENKLNEVSPVTKEIRDNSHTLAVKGLNIDSCFEIGQQISYIALKQDFNSDNLDLALYNLFTLLTSYQKSSANNIQVLYRFVKEATSISPKHKYKIKSILSNLNEVAYQCIKVIGDVNMANRFYPESSKLDSSAINKTNRDLVLLYSELYRTLVNSSLNENNFSTLDYSKAVLSGRLTDDFVEYPILKHSHHYLKTLDKYIANVIENVQDSIDDEAACHIVQLLNWRSRFVKICSVPIFVKAKNSRTPILKEDVVPLLYVHSKWLQKHLVRALFNLLPAGHKLLRELDAVSKNISLEDNDERQIYKVSKKLRKSYVQPKLYENQSEYDRSISRSDIYDRLTFDFKLPADKQIKKLNVVAITDYTLALDVPPQSNMATIENNIDELLNETSNKASLDLKVIPITSYVIQRIIGVLQKAFIQVTSNSPFIGEGASNILHNNLDVLSDLVDIAKVSKGFPVALLNLLQVIQNIQKGEDTSQLRISSIPSKFWDEFYKAVTNSPSTYPLPFLGIDKKREDESDDTVDTVPAHSHKLSMNLPLLLYYVQKLTVSENEGSQHLLSYETVALRDRAEYSVLLGKVLDIIWKNIGTLDLTASKKLELDAKFEIEKYELLLHHLKTITSNKDDESSIIDQLNLHDQSFPQLMKNANEIYQELQNIKKDKIEIRPKVLTTQLSFLTSLIYIKVVSEMAPVDHVEKARLKIAYIDEDIKMFDALLSAYYIHGVVSGSINEDKPINQASDVTLNSLNANKDNLKTVHPYCDILFEMREKTAEGVLKYATGNTFRPAEPTYGSFAKDCKHFTKSVLSTKAITDLATNLINTCNNLQNIIYSNTFSSSDIRNAHTVVKEATSWLYSVNAFYTKIKTSYSEAFPDLAKPLQTSLSQITYSVTSIKDLINELIVKAIQMRKLSELGITNTLGEIVTDLLVYPNSIPNKKERDGYMRRYVTSDFKKLLSKDELGLAKESTEYEYMEVLKMNLAELRMHCTALDNIDKSTSEAVNETLNAIVKAWEKQQADIEKKKQDDEALYVTKSKCEDIDEETEAHNEIMEMFPSHSDTDFEEFKPPSLEQKQTKQPQKATQKLIVAQDDVTLVYKWHSNFIRSMTKADWLAMPKKAVANNVLDPFLNRYPIFSWVTMGAWESFDADIEGKLSPSLIVLLNRIQAKVDGNDTSGDKTDFYRSPWVSETRQALPLLIQVKEATNVLLDQWPDFPTLRDIMVIVNRILSFPVTSPVSRFLTGLELLRDKIEEWNRQAHKGNNMIDISLAVGQQIINWRKLEMGHWKECLNNLYQRKQTEAHKYWFYLYSVIKQVLYSEANDPTSRVTSVLKDFMESSNLAEFDVRLDIVYVFHCHLVHFEASEKRDELLSILWNTYNYYAQFSAQVAATLKDKRAPIEKKLRDFVKICTWDRDLSYWSVKNTVDKAHKALHKHTKEFENVLKESVASCLTDKSHESGTEHVGIWDRPRRAAGANAGGAYLVDLQNYVVLPRNVKKYLEAAEAPSALLNPNSLISRTPSLLAKAKALCKEAATAAGYPARLQALDDSVAVVIDTSEHLAGLEVDTTQPKDKQKSQANNMVQQKRKALADLFKYLHKIGLNYRTGLVILSSNEQLYDFTIPPIDLDASFAYLKPRRCDASLSLLWSGCEKYFQRNIARHRLMTAALQSPHQDLGIQNIERCKGFAAYLLKLTNTQKKSISKYSSYLYDLRTLTTNLMNALDVETNDNNLSTIQNRLDLLTECYANASIVLEQYAVLIKSCPEKPLNAENEPDFDSKISNSPIVRCFKNSDEWNELNKKIASLVTAVNKQKTSLHKLTNASPARISLNLEGLPIISQNHIDTTEAAINNLVEIQKDLITILQEYEFTLKSPIVDDYEPKHPLLRSIDDLSKYITDVLSNLEDLITPKDEQMEEDQTELLIEQTEDLIATMLLIIQSVYKKHLTTHNTSSDDVIEAIDEIIENKEETKEAIEDKHLKERLHDRLSNDVKQLQLDTLINKISDLLVSYVHARVTQRNVEGVKNVVMRLVPILEQTVLFVQYFVTQQVAVHRVSCKMLSVLLKIFASLATKGFCKPSDMDEEGSAGGAGALSGTGLGEGEGKTDVSDKIENQDQLDDAHRPGEEKKEEDRDCKEEEKGVNMTDDFDSHLQDVDKKDGEDSDQEDEDDADKQMGDTDNAAEKLDQQIWGSDEEDVEEENKQKNEKEERGKGESTGEKDMAAKEEEKGEDDGSDGKDKKKQKDINEMDEPEVDEDHVDPYHGNHPEYPEPEDFELPEPENTNEESDNEGETETENPFEIEINKDKIVEQEEEEKGDDNKDNKNGLEVSSDEEGEGDDDGQGTEDNEAKPGENESKEDKQDEEKDGNEDEETNVDNMDQEDNNPENPDAPQELESPENKEEELPKNDEKINEEDEIEKKKEANSQANPSNNDPTAQDQAENAEMDQGTNDNVETNAEQKKDEDAEFSEQSQEQVGDEKQSTGRSELDKSDKGHRGEKQAASRADNSKDKRKQHENKPGKTSQDRTLGEINEKKQKKSQMLNVEREEDDDAPDGGSEEGEEKEADAYQHVKEAKKDDLQAIDAATKDQADQQPTLQQDDEDADKLKEDEEIPMEVDDEDIQIEKSEELQSEKVKEGPDKEMNKAGSKKESGDDPTGETGVDVEGETVVTEHVARGSETSYHTAQEQTRTQAEALDVQEYMSIRDWVRDSRSLRGGESSAAVWRGLWRESAPAARALCETLRLVLEPTGRSRMTGDYRTGRAINMRRVIPYIASHFRKDRIWLRRTKPAKREYKIAIAVDDSSSMADNRSKELAFESLALVSQALNLLESGDLAVLSFGEQPNLLHPFTEQFSEHSGSKILERLRFEQTKTKIAQLLNYCTVIFEQLSVRSDAVNAKLLVIVSDGRGIFSEGETKVLQAVRRARQQGIFLVYVVIDNPDNKDSIMDIRRPLLDPETNAVKFEQYLDRFPFPYYLILRDMAALPTVLGDALRQWFELAANNAS